VIYTADHGTPGRNGPLQGGKGGLWDGGIRIPLFIRGPIAKAGSHTSVLATGADLVPTVADLAGIAEKMSDRVEGGSLRQVLIDPVSGKVKRPREEIVFHFPHYDKDPLGPVSALIVGDFKLVRIYEGNRNLLFNLAKDLGEHNDLAASRSEKVRELSDRLTSYLESIDAGMPIQRSGDAPASVAMRNTNSRPDAIMQGLDKNDDGQLTKDEIEHLPALLRSLDKNQDGTLSRDETRGR
jgi:arylsulfatase A-like enzyme